MSLSIHSPLELRWSAYAWAKLLFMRDKGSTEVAGFGIAGDPLKPNLITDFKTVKMKTASAASFEFDDIALSDFQIDHSHVAKMAHDQFWRVWVHTHPGNSATPSVVDWNTFNGVFGDVTWQVMMILARGGEVSALFRQRLPVPLAFQCAVIQDFAIPGPATDDAARAAWDEEYTRNVPATTYTPYSGGGSDWYGGHRQDGYWRGQTFYPYDSKHTGIEKLCEPPSLARVAELEKAGQWVTGEPDPADKETTLYSHKDVDAMLPEQVESFLLIVKNPKLLGWLHKRRAALLAERRKLIPPETGRRTPRSTPPVDANPDLSEIEGVDLKSLSFPQLEELLSKTTSNAAMDEIGKAIEKMIILQEAELMKDDSTNTTTATGTTSTTAVNDDKRKTEVIVLSEAELKELSKTPSSNMTEDFTIPVASKA